MFSRHFAPTILYVLLSLPLAAVADPGNLGIGNDELTGTVQSGETPVAFAAVSLYRAGRQHRGAGAVLLGKSQSDSDGYFEIFYKTPADPYSVLYLVAEGQRTGPVLSPVKLAAVLDNAAIPADIVINERTPSPRPMPWRSLPMAGRSGREIPRPAKRGWYGTKPG